MEKIFLLILISLIFSALGEDTTLTEESNASVVSEEENIKENIEKEELSLSESKKEKKETSILSSSTTTPNEIENLLKIGGTVDMQVEKKMYDEYMSGSDNRFSDAILRGYRKMVDDFWLRVGLKLSYKLKNLESVLAFRVYPYWSMRRKDAYARGGDLSSYLDVFELTQAYFKAFKEYKNSENSFNGTIYFKAGRDGLLNNCSQLFGNYLDQPAGGYGDSRYDNIIGPFKNRKVFANQIEVGALCNVGTIVTTITSLMIGGNVNNEKWYGAPLPAIYQEMDSKLSAGFLRGYQDVYLLNKKIHLGGGFRVYITMIDSASTRIIPSKYINGSWLIEGEIIPDLKLYTEMGYQKLGTESRVGIVRPINAGITIPTFKVVDILAIEVENVADTYFSNKSMRDAVRGRKPTKSFGWGIVVEKIFAERIDIAWGLYTGTPTADMKTTLRISSIF